MAGATVADLDRLYQDILGRPAQGDRGASIYLGKDLASVQAELERSEEFRRRQIMQLYSQVLGRDADAAGLDHYTQLSNGGASLDDIRADMTRSAEWKGSEAAVMQDPAYAAFARKANLDQSMIEGEVQSRRESANRAMQLQGQQYDMQRQDVAEQHDRDFESRGLYRAGERLKRTANDQNKITSQQRLYEHGQREQLTAYETDAAKRLAETRRQQAEERLNARARLTQRATERAYT